jgi:GTP pyrophosphokinase
MQTQSHLSTPQHAHLESQSPAILALLALNTSAGADPAPAADSNKSLVLLRAQALAEPLLVSRVLGSGEDTLSHAQGVIHILAAIGADLSLQAAVYLVYAADYLQKPEEVVERGFGADYARLISHARKLGHFQQAAGRAAMAPDAPSQQTERVRKMLLAFSQDLRVVLLRLASRLQTLRWFTQTKQACPEHISFEALHVYAPLANRLGIGQIKWEMEDLAFRFQKPQAYREIAHLLDERRLEREARVQRMVADLQQLLTQARITAEVAGRPKHIYSIWRKMQSKALAFHRVMDVSALRVMVSDINQCYAVLALVHSAYNPIDGEFDDYIAKPKANGYQSLHTVVAGSDGRAIEIQIRTREMHEYAEYGVAAHWAYKESAGKAPASAKGEYEARIAQARKAVIHQLFAWERDTVAAIPGQSAGWDDRIYVLTPQAAVVDLPTGATPIDFAYAVHTQLGHRCRGAKVDGVMVSLNTPLENGQTVEVFTIKEGGPSLDWLNTELGYLISPRSKAKVRAWFNALEIEQADATRARETPAKVQAKDDAVSTVADDSATAIALRRSQTGQGDHGVLVVGVGSLLTTLAKCCRPVPPDAIQGYVTRERGVAIHRAGCSNLAHMLARQPDRGMEVAWNAMPAKKGVLYPLDLQIEASDRPGLLRDISEVLVREKINVTGVNTQSIKGKQGGTAHMTFTLEMADMARLSGVLRQIQQLDGVRFARRR